MKKNKKSILLISIVILAIISTIGLLCSILPKATVSKLQISKMYVYNGAEVADIDRNDKIFDLLSDEAESIIDLLDSENSVIDACFTYTGNGNAGLGAGIYRLLEIHLEDQTNLMLGGTKQQSIKTLVFILDENTVFAYQDDCENESESLIGCSYDSADKEKLLSLLMEVN